MPEYPQPGGDQRSQQKFLVFDRFEKMNTQAARTGLPDNQLAWLENLQPLSENKLQVVPAAAAAAFNSIPETINLGFYAFLNGHDYAILFTTAGAAYFIDFTTNTTGQVASDGTFSLAPDCTTYQGSVLLINDIKAGYSVWNTFCFIQAGGVSPNIVIGTSGVGVGGGSGYGSPPAVNFHNATQGVDVPGAVGVALLSGGVVVGVNVLNGGGSVNPGDVINVSFITGGGSGATFKATMTASHVISVNISQSGGWPTGTGPAPGTYPLVISAGGATATATVVTGAGGVTNFVSAVTVTAGGSYAAPPPPACTWNSASFPIPSGGIVPAFHIGPPNMSQTSIASIAVTAGGAGYPVSSTQNLTFMPPGAPTPAVGTCHVTAGGVVNTATITTGGTFNFGPPPMIDIAGGGSGAFTYAQGWPSVPAGTTLAVFQGRVFLGGGQLLQWTGTGANAGYAASATPGPGYDDFQSIDASGSLQIVDADLVHAIKALRALNNYLWIIGDQSVKQIGNLSVTATSPPITQFTILTLSSDQGTVWPQSCISFNRLLLFANPNGIFGVFGSTVQKISDDLDGIFQRGIFTSMQPQGAIVDLNTKHNAVFLVSYNDPAGGARSLLLMFDGKKWWLANQGANVVSILTFPDPQSDLNTLYGTLSGSDLTQLFAQPSVAVPFKMITALSHGGNPVQGKRAIRAGFTADAAAVGTINIEIDADSATHANAFGVSANSLLIGGANDASNTPVAGAGVYLGATLTGTLANLVIQNVIIEYQETALWKGAGVTVGPPYTTEDGLISYTTEDGSAVYTS
jgi:hypothetical protein